MAAHSLKGAVSHFGAEPTYKAAQQLELMGRNGQMQDAVEAVAALDRAIECLLSALRTLSNG